MTDPTPYPGAQSALADLFHLAEEYRRAAQAVASLGRKGVAISRAPYRLIAIHAIELYLNVLLLHAGHQAARIRGLQHDLGARIDLLSADSPQLRRRTAEHLKAMAASREYLVTRYEPELASTLSHPTRVAATLEELAVRAKAVVT